MPTGAELLVEGLRRAGVEVVFGLPGVHNLPAWRALAASGIRLVTVRHEQTAVYAADGYARATGRAGVALTTTGPGAANALGALGEAWASRSPVVLIATDVATSLSKPGHWRGALHEMEDQAELFRPLVKEALRGATAEGLDTLVSYAVATAGLAPSRPVYIEIPSDRLSSEGAESEGGGARFLRMAPAAAQMDAAVRRLAEAERPLIWAGGGALSAGAGAAVEALAERLGAPVITTYSARGLIPPDHPCLVGLPPHVLEVGALWDEADVVLAVGTDFDGMMTQNWRMPKPPFLIAVNVDEADAAKSYGPNLMLSGDAAIVCAALVERLGEDRPLPDLEPLRRRAWDRLASEHPDEVEFVRVCERVLPSDGVVVCDMCIPGYWLAGFLPVHRPRGLQYPMGWGTLGYAFPAAIGAALSGAPSVVSISGDGGFLFACGELATVAQEKIPLTAVVVDDGGYGMLRYDQVGEPEQHGIDLDTPDFVALARAFGVDAERVTGLGADFGTALGHHIADPAPSVLVADAALEPPPTTSPRWYRAG